MTQMQVCSWLFNRKKKMSCPNHSTSQHKVGALSRNSILKYERSDTSCGMLKRHYIILCIIAANYTPILKFVSWNPEVDNLWGDVVAKSKTCTAQNRNWAYKLLKDRLLCLSPGFEHLKKQKKGSYHIWWHTWHHRHVCNSLWLSILGPDHFSACLTFFGT